jgi:hypothetical protein
MKPAGRVWLIDKRRSTSPRLGANWDLRTGSSDDAKLYSGATST